MKTSKLCIMLRLCCRFMKKMHNNWSANDMLATTLSTLSLWKAMNQFQQVCFNFLSLKKIKIKTKKKKLKSTFYIGLITSHFTYVFVVVRRISASPPRFRVGVCAKDGVRPFGPPLPDPPIFDNDSRFADWLAAKVSRPAFSLYF